MYTRATLAYIITHSTWMLLLRPFSLAPSALRASRRLLSQSSTKQAFLEPLVSHPGVTCLSLNRPQSKNAISRTLLQVNKSLMIVEQVLFINMKELRESLESVQFDKRFR